VGVGGDLQQTGVKLKLKESQGWPHTLSRICAQKIKPAFILDLMCFKGLITVGAQPKFNEKKFKGPKKCVRVAMTIERGERELTNRLRNPPSLNVQCEVTVPTQEKRKEKGRRKNYESRGSNSFQGNRKTERPVASPGGNLNKRKDRRYKGGRRGRCGKTGWFEKKKGCWPRDIHLRPVAWASIFMWSRYLEGTWKVVGGITMKLFMKICRQERKRKSKERKWDLKGGMAQHLGKWGAMKKGQSVTH